MATRNYEEYRAQALAELGEDYTVEDLRNEEKFRKKVLDSLGAEYTDEDTHNFERYRLKVLENLSGGGGGDFTTAIVTFSDVNEMGWCFAAPLIAITPNQDFPEAFPYIEHTFFSDTTDARTIVLYKGVAIIDIISDEGGTLSVSGNAVLGLGAIKVTGDCTITIS